MSRPSESLTSKDLPAGVFIGAGSRDGDRAGNMRAALDGLAAQGLSIRRVSSLYETEPVDLPGPERLLNGVFEVATVPPPDELLALCLSVERALGRRRDQGRLGSRPIDLDILLYQDRVIRGDDLVIPHPRMHQRRFVLVPLAEIAPEAMHPLLRLTAAELLKGCGDTSRVELSAPPALWRR